VVVGFGDIVGDMLEDGFGVLLGWLKNIIPKALPRIMAIANMLMPSLKVEFIF
jgi:hypothetical protein